VRGVAYASDFEAPYTLQYNLTLEQGFGNQDTVSVGYVGARGRRLGRVESIRNGPVMQRIDVVRDNATSDYHALQVQVRHPLAHGLQVLGAYTWSKSLDTVSDESLSNFQAPVARFSPNIDRGPSAFDVRHSFNAAASYSIPFRSSNSVLSALGANYGLDARVRAVSARPVYVSIGRDPLTFGNTNLVRPDLIPGQPLYVQDSTVPGGRKFNPAAFDSNTPFNTGRQGTLGRNVLRGFPASQLDMSVRREFRLGEGWKLQARVDAFNVLNQSNFANPPGRTTDANFGVSIQTLAAGYANGTQNPGGLNSLYQVGGPRSLEIALKILY
jgi:hypothetical protein